MKASKILIVDDDPALRLAIHDYLLTKGFLVDEAGDLPDLRNKLRTARPDAIVLDYKLAHETSLDVVPEIKAVHPNLPIIILTGHASIDLAVTAIKAGADQFMTKPVQLDALQVMLQRLLSARRAVKRDAATRTRIASKTPDPFLGASEPMQRLRRDAERVAATERPVLIEGETGAGKGVLAAWLHRSGPRAEEPLVDLNCAAFARELIDSELFGHERGAFTGAVSSRQGLFEVADGGTLFLDEIGDMDLALQAKLLKAVEEKRFRRVGDPHERSVDVRLIAATHRNLAELARQQQFRSDLYFRISTMRLEIPPLRARREDIPLLARTLVRDLAAEICRQEPELDQRALDALLRYDWPGNVRELRNVLERALLLGDAGVISANDLRFDFENRQALSDNLEDAERAHVQRVVAEESGDVDRAAARLGIARSTLYQKLKRYGV
jgi:DNA-binding NtrC family response regulator